MVYRRIVTFHQPYSDELFQGPDFSTPCKHDGSCAKDRKIKWSFQAKRRVDKEWENENFLRRKRTVIRRREEVENNQIDEET